MKLLAEGTFTPYGPSHWALLILIVVGSVLLAARGRRLRASFRAFDRLFAAAILAFQVPLLIYMMLPPRYSIYDSLP